MSIWTHPSTGWYVCKTNSIYQLVLEYGTTQCHLFVWVVEELYWWPGHVVIEFREQVNFSDYIYQCVIVPDKEQELPCVYIPHVADKFALGKLAWTPKLWLRWTDSARGNNCNIFMFFCVWRVANIWRVGCALSCWRQMNVKSRFDFLHGKHCGPVKTLSSGSCTTSHADLR